MQLLQRMVSPILKVPGQTKKIVSIAEFNRIVEVKQIAIMLQVW